MALPKSQCIWCLEMKAGPAPPEHIIPQAMDCPETLILTDGEVCHSCNNRLGRVDSAVVHSFELMTFMRSPTRGGRPRKIVGLSNLRTHYTPGQEPKIVVNLSKKDKAPVFGGLVPPSRPGKRSATATTKDLGGGKALISVSYPFLQNRMFSRGLHKIALELTVIHEGRDFAAQPSFDEVRRFTIGGRGTRHALITGPKRVDGEEEVQTRLNTVFSPPPDKPADGQAVIGYAIGGVGFLVDLSPGQSHLPEIVKIFRRALGDEGWTYAPLDRKLPGLEPPTVE